MSSQDIPPALEQLRPFLEKEKLPWEEMKEGDRLTISALDAENDAVGDVSLMVLVCDKDEEDKEHIVFRLEQADIRFGSSASHRQPLELPAGTLMSAGVSCQHFLETSVFMAYIGGIATGRDFSFKNAWTPEGEMVDGVAIRGVENIAKQPGKLTDGDQAELGKYDEEVRKYDKQQKEQQAVFAKELDAAFKAWMEKEFDAETCESIWDIVKTFSVEGRYRLAGLLEHATEQKVTEKYLAALKRAMKEEFTWSPSSDRGAMFLPASHRGYQLMIEELGLK